MSEYPTEPAPPVLPESEPRGDDIGSRLAVLSDAVLGEDGRVSQILGKLDALLRLTQTAVNQAVANSERIDRLERRASKHSGALRLLLPADVIADLDGNGAAE